MMGIYFYRVKFYRISLLLVVALSMSACVPVSRAQGPDPAYEAGSHAQYRAAEPGRAYSAVAYTAPDASGAPAAPSAVSMADTTVETTGDPSSPVRVFHPLVYRVAQAEPVPSELRVWMDLSLQPELVAFYNMWADEHDIARIEHVSMMDVLDQVTVGRKLVIFKNVADAEEAIPLLADRMDIIGYNLEGGPANLPEEQADPVGSARRMRTLADAYGLKVALGPSRDFALDYGVEMAPYVDFFVLQVQRVQTDHETVRDFVLPLLESLTAANPDLEISVQLRTEGDVSKLVKLVDSLGPELAGVSILTSQDTLSTAYSLVEAVDDWRRSRPSATPTPGASPDAAPPATATPTMEPRRTPTQAPDSVPGRSDPPDAPTRWFLFGSGLLFGVLVAMLGGTWVIFMFQRMRTR